MGKAITLQSTEGPGVTIIDGAQKRTSVVTFENDEGPDSVLEGFMITNGRFGGGDVGGEGGGIFCGASPTLIKSGGGRRQEPQ